jgi:endonuclease VIII
LSLAEPTGGNRPLTEVSFAFDRLKSFETELTAARIVSVTPKGKALLTRFSNQLTIYSHNQLYGVWYSRRAYDYPTTNRQLRLAIHTEKRSALLYSASDIAVLDDDQIAAHPFLQKLGPDVLEAVTTVEMVLDRLQSKTFHRKGFPSLLLNRHFLGGLGNYLRSEVLFVAGIHPTLRPIDCSSDRLQKLAAALLELPRQSYATKGITNSLALAEPTGGNRQTTQATGSNPPSISPLGLRSRRLPLSSLQHGNSQRHSRRATGLFLSELSS